jgi:hypothetical protein
VRELARVPGDFLDSAPSRLAGALDQEAAPSPGRPPARPRGRNS